MTVSMTLEDYYQRLRGADWSYQYANGSAYARGADAMWFLRRISVESDDHRKVFDAMKACGDAGQAMPTFDAVMSGG